MAVEEGMQQLDTSLSPEGVEALPTLSPDGAVETDDLDSTQITDFQDSTAFRQFWARYSKKWNPYQLHAGTMVAEHCSKAEIEKHLDEIAIKNPADVVLIKLAKGHWLEHFLYHSTRSTDQRCFVAWWRRHLPDLIDLAIYSAEWRAKKRQEIVEDCIARHKYTIALTALRDMDEWQRTQGSYGKTARERRKDEPPQQWTAKLTERVRTAMIAGPTPPGGFRPQIEDKANAKG